MSMKFAAELGRIGAAPSVNQDSTYGKGLQWSLGCL
jgi:hypothetical protein